MQFQKSPSQRVIAEMENEVARLLGTGPSTLAWNDARQNQGRATPGKLAFIRFDGTCDATPEGTGNFSRRVTLGSTEISGGRILPLMEIQCDKLREFLGRMDAQRAYGRALGQVVAHELYHVLLETGAHSLKGISKAAHSPQELGRITNQFEPAIRARMLAAFVP